MTEPPDPLETELAALQPHDVSPGLRRRVAERLADAPRSTGWRLRWLVLASALAAACVTVVLVWWGSRRPVKQEQVTFPLRASPSVAEPTLLDYERALARSPEELDALLSQRAVGAQEPEVVPACSFARSDAALHALLGDD
jgi:hypothetical protein